MGARTRPRPDAARRPDHAAGRPPLNRPVLRLLPGRASRLRAGHPWVFSNEIVMDAAARAIPPGTVVRVEGPEGERHAAHYGAFHFNPRTLIAARLLSRDPDAAVDAAFWRARLERALALRERLFPAPFYRLVHAEADGFPGLVLDRYGDLVTLQANTAGMEAATPDLLAALRDLLHPRAVVARNDSGVRALEGLPEHVGLLHGTDPAGTVEEGGVTFAVDPVGGQKTGWFFDQRANRALVASLSRSATVLDAFCHTGGFGLQAASAGASHVTLLDRSEHALATAVETARRNGLDDRVETIRGDAVDTIAGLVDRARRFDVVVVDPPAFAKARKDAPNAVRAYQRLARLAAALVEPGGIFFAASCSHHVPPAEFHEAVLSGVARARREGRILAITGAGPDHPVHPMLPESAYLKALTLQLD